MRSLSFDSSSVGFQNSAQAWPSIRSAFGRLWPVHQKRGSAQGVDRDVHETLSDRRNCGAGPSGWSRRCASLTLAIACRRVPRQPSAFSAASPSAAPSPLRPPRPMPLPPQSMWNRHRSTSPRPGAGLCRALLYGTLQRIRPGMGLATGAPPHLRVTRTILKSKAPSLGAAPTPYGIERARARRSPRSDFLAQLPPRSCAVPRDGANAMTTTIRMIQAQPRRPRQTRHRREHLPRLRRLGQDRSAAVPNLRRHRQGDRGVGGG